MQCKFGGPGRYCCVYSFPGWGVKEGEGDNKSNGEPKLPAQDPPCKFKDSQFSLISELEWWQFCPR